MKLLSSLLRTDGNDMGGTPEFGDMYISFELFVLFRNLGGERDGLNKENSNQKGTISIHFESFHMKSLCMYHNPYNK